MMKEFGLASEIIDRDVYSRTVQRFAERSITLPTFAQLADPSTIPQDILDRLEEVDPDAAHPLNLFRVHWFNDADRRHQAKVPNHIVLPKSLTGVDAKIVIALGNRFPMIDAHKVLAAYGCLAPRLVSGEFDPTAHRAVWPSTGNYCRGGVAISRIMACRGVAVLPAGMSAERFEWLDKWCMVPAEDVIRTHGTESNVKEIYDACHELELDKKNFIFNQFSEFANHLVHYAVTGAALSAVYGHMLQSDPSLQLAAFVSATGSAGTIAAGDYLKDHHGSLTVAVEALECPTMLYNGFGEHNIQGIGDKHLPLIHNILDNDFAVAISEASTDQLFVLFNTEVGRNYLVERRGIARETVDSLEDMGISSICNMLAAIKTAKYLGLGEDQVIVTVATDGAAMYGSEREKALSSYFDNDFDVVNAGEVFGQHLAGAGADHVMELSHVDKNRIFNLGYFTWVEQQGISYESFIERRKPEFWSALHEFLPAWDTLIEQFNADVAAARSK